MSITQEEFKKLTRDDLEKLKFVLDSNGNVCVRGFGVKGDKGESVLNGTVDPTTEGVDGDFYINTTSWQIFGPKTGGVWGTGTNIQGQVQTVVGGSNIIIDNTDPNNPIINFSLGTDENFVTDEEKTAISVMSWNATDKTIDINQGNGVIQQVGQEQFWRGKNQTGSAINQPSVVYANGALGASGIMTIAKYIANGSIAGMYVLGITTEDIADGSDGFITTFGKIRGIDTTGTPYNETWNEGDVLYVSPTTAGYLTNVKPTLPHLVIPIAFVVNVHSTQGTIAVRVPTPTPLASEVINVPTGNISSTNIQSAINELDTEKANLSGATFTGDINSPNINGQPTYTTTETSSKGGLLINIDSATGGVARTTSGELENNSALGLFARQEVAGWSAEADTAVLRTGNKTLKISTTNTSGRASVILGGTNRDATYAGYRGRLIQLKPNTKYKISCWVKTNNVATNSVYIRLWQWDSNFTSRTFNSSNQLTGTNDWTLLTTTITTGGTISYGAVSCEQDTAGNISDAWFDINSMKFEEIIETTNDNLTSKEQGVLGFTAIGSTDNIDQSQLTSDAVQSLNTTTLFAYRFTPIKSKLTSISVYLAKVGSPTDNVVLEIQTNNAGFPSGTIIASSILLASSISTSKTLYTFNVPAILTIGSDYHIVVKRSGVEDLSNYINIYRTNTDNGSGRGSLKGKSWIGWARQLYFTEQYYKPTTAFNASLNGESIDIRADEDGFLDGAKIDLVNGKYIEHKTFGTNGTAHLTAFDGNRGGAGGIFSSQYADRYRFDGAGEYFTVKVKSPVNMKNISLKTKIATGGLSGRTQKIQYSLDNSTWIDLEISTTSSTTIEKLYNLDINTDLFYIRYYNVDTNVLFIYYYNIQADIDTSSIKTLYNYPTNKSNKQTYVKTLTSATTTAIYRATKYGFPAIEFTNGEYQFLKINCEATDSVVKLSANGVTYTTVTDGGSIALSSTTLPTVYTDITITKNRLLMASNDYNNSSDKDGSLQAGVVSMNKQQGLVYDVQDLQRELNDLKEAVRILQSN